MVRVLNFFCFAVTALACLALYHVSEETRVSRVELRSVERQITDQDEAMKVLQADWQRVSDPARIQRLAAEKLSVSDTPTMALASLELLPRRDDSKGLEQASVETPIADPRIHYVSVHAGE